MSQYSAHPMLPSTSLLHHQRQPPQRPSPIPSIDKIFVISLPSRKNRLKRIQTIFDHFNIDFETYAVDGRKLTRQNLIDGKIAALEGYLDPYHKRPLTMGEVGCFLSHYNIWKRMVDSTQQDGKGGGEVLNRVLILEDDARLPADFVQRATRYIKAADDALPSSQGGGGGDGDGGEYEGGWDLLYLGRKPMDPKSDRLVENSDRLLVYPGYSYWTVGYVLTRRGAVKLLRQSPLSRLMAVDEFLPAMFDRQPHQQFAAPFHPRDVIALAIAPPADDVIEPFHDPVEEGDVSDTERSATIDEVMMTS